MTSPAERYAASRERQSEPEFASFRTLYDFDYDDFQVAACRALGTGSGVLVAAPTGSGKTVVGEYSAAPTTPRSPAAAPTSAQSISARAAAASWPAAS